MHVSVDAGAARRLAERFAARGAEEAALAQTPRAAALLVILGSHSPYLSDLAVRDSACFAAVLAEGADKVAARILAELAATPPATRRAQLAATLRRAKRQIALAIAMADIENLWPVDQVVATLSDFAEAALRLCVDHLLLDAASRHELALPDPAHPSRRSGFMVLGMGKLGAGELNYSSDIDLVLLYDPAPQMKSPEINGGEIGSDEEHSSAWEFNAGLAATYSRLARGLVALMQQRDSDGYVFRTDLRLRPDPGATPPAVSLPAALTYYESLGQNWERAAMLKARPVAGDLAAGQAFLDAIRPFIWRRGLDFAAVADIAGMKRRIDRAKGLDRARPPDAIAQIAGFDLKLGQGGIREIEFLTQTLQLVWGGRDPSLRDNTTLGGLRALLRAGHLHAEAAAELAESYRLLRRLEHRVQMVADRQTHQLPQTPAELEGFARFFGLDNAAQLADLLLRHLARVRRHYAEIFDTVPDAGPCQGLDFTGPDAQPATLAQLTELGFTNPAAIVSAVQGWQAGRVRALRSERARELMHQMLPPLLAALARQPQPDTAFTRLDQLLGRLPEGVQPLSLMQRNPALLDRIAAVLGAAPALADYLASVPQALDGLVSPGDLPRPTRRLRERLMDASGLEQAIAAIRGVTREIDFAISVDTLEARMDADISGLHRSGMADAAIGALLPYVAADVTRRFGSVPGGGVVIVALGKAGSREMMAGSDLDLVLIYDQPTDVTESIVSRGASGRPVPVTQYYSRVAQCFIAALTAPGPGGPLYAVDMRLRPSGNAGPVAVSLASFRHYHRDTAWTWERMAITRARVVAGPPILSDRVAAALTAAIERPADADALKRDAATMRARLARDLPPANDWDVKHRVGGLMEVEFIAQVLTLAHAAAHPHIAHPTTRIAFARLRDAGLLSAADAALLIAADHLWRTVQGMLRVTVGRAADKVLPAASAEALLRAVARADVTDQASLHRCLDETGAAVRTVFERLVGRPDPSLLEKHA
jgi:glutamate-ammonia-ligase adenylyltransferase